MNFSRRLIDGAINAVQATTSSSSSAPQASTQPPPLSNIKTGSNWPPLSPSANPDASFAGENAASPQSPPTTTVKSFFRRPSTPTATKDKDPPNEYSGASSGRPPGSRNASISNPTNAPRRSQSPASFARARLPNTVKQSPGITRIKPPSQNPPAPKWQAAPANAKEELILELLASEAVVDSRDADILTSEEVDELKRELQALATKVTALNRKLSLETKVRDAAVTLNKLNASHKKLSKSTSDSLEASNRKVEAVQKELNQVSQRHVEVQRKLLEHRAGILSYTVGRLEAQLRPPPGATAASSGRSTPAGPSMNGTTLDGSSSPTSVVTSMSGTSRVGRFDGPHFFAGHSDAIPPVPKLSQNGVSDEKMRAIEEELEAARRAEEEVKQDLARVRLQKSELENSLGSNLQTAEETISRLRAELDRMGTMEEELSRLKAENKALQDERFTLEQELRGRDDRLQETQQRLVQHQRDASKAAGYEETLSRVTEDAKKDLDRKEDELKALRVQLEEERAAWENEKQALEEDKLEELDRLQQELESKQGVEAELARATEEELDSARRALQSLIRSHRIMVAKDVSIGGASDSHIPTLAVSIGAHLDSLEEGQQKHAKEKEEWDELRRKLEFDLRSSLDRREALGQEVEGARNEREEARRELRIVEERLRDLEMQTVESPTIAKRTAKLSMSTKSFAGNEDYSRVISTLRSLWAILPSPEARAAKAVNTRAQASPNSPLLTPPIRTGSSQGSDTQTSLSDLDVRALKALYDPRISGASSPLFASFSAQSEFSIDAFEGRVRALLADDRAIIERLIRFAQAHDLLKNNAARAQKLAQESSVGLETYQKQVKSLEERNSVLIGKQQSLIDELNTLQEELEKALKEKRELEMNGTDQGETIKNLTDANNTLTSRNLALAEEVATAPEAMRIKMEAQIAEVRRQLNEAHEDIDRLRNAETSQSFMLLNELNSAQAENAKLMDQLRAEQRKNAAK